MTIDIAMHKGVLLNLLKDIYGDAELGPVLGFKGGTAAYLFYGLPRFSVDLDFDLLDIEEAEAVFEKLKEILSEYGHVAEARKKRYTFFYRLVYANKIENAYNIKVEVNKRNFGAHYEVKTYLGIPMKVMVREDMAAHKLVAMFERMGKTNRDVFDVWFFLKHNWPINGKIVQSRTGMSLKDFLLKCIEELEARSDRGILSGLGELLNAKQRSWAKEKLRSETIFLLKVRGET
ncbi:MAG: nucleotidyl transferase AbiEii/AbiGii toxin family protein [Candidatus Dependentiae bacterium]|nr:nucleotidyl transferase AbiEii/AbiGii toxin family protein [Candidatus Dependentiae bacterium]